MDNTITWFGQASYQLILQQQVIYLDPVIKLDLCSSLAKADLILITHDHYDHYDLPTILALSKPNTIIITHPSVNGDNNPQFKPLNINETYTFNELKITGVPAYNLNKPYHPPGMGLGFLITDKDFKLYHAGDTDLIKAMHDLKDITIALLPIGGTYTMDLKEAVQATNIIKPTIVIPMHYLTANPYEFKQLVGSKAYLLEEGTKYDLNDMIDEVKKNESKSH